MFKVCFYSYYADKQVIFSSHRTLKKAIEVARKMYIETGKTHYILTADSKKLDRYGKEFNETQE